ncbi:phosphotransferase family protein [Plantactinospora siamensis]|uniref:Phosphotransferase family protein n=1 Tax=Plantactinospora siamensis TaxID=555372 RepID=A0ABV6NYG1_9ACTN
MTGALSTGAGRAPRLAAERMLAAVAGHTGVRLDYLGPCSGGEVGAAYVRWPDGRRGVLGRDRQDVAGLVRLAGDAGVPVPGYDLVAPLDGGGWAVVQRLLPGAAPATVDRSLFDGLLAINSRLRGLLADRDDLPPLPLHLRSSGPGFCVHESLAGYDRRTARLLERVRAVGAERDAADGPDLVHADFHPGNVLVDAGRITGVVDWDGAARGDGWLDLVTLRFDLALRAPTLGSELAERLRAAVPPDRLRAYWAHMALRQVDWSIRHHGPAEVDRWLEVAEAAPLPW